MANPVTVTCACGARYTVEIQSSPRTARCTKCGGAIEIPGIAAVGVRPALVPGAPPAGQPAAPAAARTPPPVSPAGPGAPGAGQVGGIHVQCECGKTLVVPAAQIGTTGRCPGCGRPIVALPQSGPQGTPQGAAKKEEVWTFPCSSCGSQITPDHPVCPYCGWDEDKKRRACIHCQGHITLASKQFLRWTGHFTAFFALVAGFFLSGLFNAVAAFLVLECLFLLWRAKTVAYHCEACGKVPPAEAITSREEERLAHNRKTYYVQFAGVGAVGVLLAALSFILPASWQLYVARPEKVAETGSVEEKQDAPRDWNAETAAAVLGLRSPDPAARRVAAAKLDRIAKERKDLRADNCQEAVRELGKCLQDSDPSVRTEAAIALGSYSFVAREAPPLLLAALKDAANELRTQDAIFEALVVSNGQRDIGPGHEVAIPAILRALPDNPNRADRKGKAALEALGRLGEPGILGLAAVLSDPTAANRRRAASALGAISTGTSGTAATALLGALSDSDEAVRQVARAVLTGMPATAAWADAVRDFAVSGERDAALRVQAVEILGERARQSGEVPRAMGEIAASGASGSGPKATELLLSLGLAEYLGAGNKAAIPSLIETVRKNPWPGAQPCQGAIDALVKIGADSVPPAAALLADRDPGVRRAAAYILESLASSLPGLVIPALLAAAQDSDSEVKDTAHRALQQIPVTEDSLAALKAGAAHEAAATRAKAVEVLSARARSSREAAATLISILAEGPQDVQAPAFQGLFRAGWTEQVGQGHESAVLALLSLVTEREYTLGPAAFVDPSLVVEPTPEEVEAERVSDAALGAIGRMEKRALAKLERALKSGDPRVKKAATRALEALGKDGVETLTDAVADDALAKDALEALRTIGPPGIAGIVAGLKSESADTRALAEEALFQVVGPGAENFLSPLIAALRDRRESVKLTVIQALGSMGPAAKRAVSSLNVCLKDKSEAVRTAAEDALRKIVPDQKFDPNPQPQPR
ncbi:MAG: HEAT repeat domain-containing protein [Planctomycetes bacterium]|nr:HEAT repeat domain-containing protein [Planctomycetota bacterium]